MLTRFVLVVLFFTGCKTAAPTTPISTAPTAESPPPGVVRPSDSSKSYNWKNDGNLRQEQGDENCRAERPDCKRPFALFDMGPNPCTSRGTYCVDTRTRENGRWTCNCDECTSQSDCSATQHCGTGSPPCSEQRLPLHCVEGPAPTPIECPPVQEVPKKVQ